MCELAMAGNQEHIKRGRGEATALAGNRFDSFAPVREQCQVKWYVISQYRLVQTMSLRGVMVYLQVL